MKGEAGLSALSFGTVLSFLVAQTLCLSMSAHIVTVCGLYFNCCSDCHETFSRFSYGLYLKHCPDLRAVCT